MRLHPDHPLGISCRHLVCAIISDSENQPVFCNNLCSLLLYTLYCFDLYIGWCFGLFSGSCDSLINSVYLVTPWTKRYWMLSIECPLFLIFCAKTDRICCFSSIGKFAEQFFRRLELGTCITVVNFIPGTEY